MLKLDKRDSGNKIYAMMWFSWRDIADMDSTKKLISFNLLSTSPKNHNRCTSLMAFPTPFRIWKPLSRKLKLNIHLVSKLTNYVNR